MRASYYDPTIDESIEIADCSERDISTLISAILSLSSGRGHPTLELIRGDGSSLALSTDGMRAYLVFTNSLGESFHSIGHGDGEWMVFDYFGSWSEAPVDSLVRLDDAVESLRGYVLSGVADTGSVLFEPE